MTVNPDVSRKFVLLSFWAMVWVCVIHSRASCLDPTSAGWFVQWFITRGLSKWAVPFFFFTSGFFFQVGKRRRWSELLRVKGRTLLIPYFLWTVIGTLLCLPLYLLVNYRDGVWLLSRTVFDSTSLWNFANQFLGITHHAPEGNAVLWYVRSLFLFFLFGPAWNVLIDKCKWLICCLVGVFLLVPSIRIPVLSIVTTHWAWIMAGMWIAAYGVPFLPDNLRCLWGGMLLMMSFGLCYVGTSIWEASYETGVLVVDHYRPWVQNLIPIFGCSFYWLLYERIKWLKLNVQVLPWWVHATFWVYCVHVVFISYFRSVVTVICGKSDCAQVSIMLASPIVGIVASLVVANIVRLRLSNVYALLTGGR